MSQVTHPTTSITAQIRSHSVVALSALLALFATTAVVLVLAVDDGSPIRSSSAAVQAGPAMRLDGGPEESAVAASVGSRPSASPSETRIAASIGAGTTRPAGGPES